MAPRPSTRPLSALVLSLLVALSLGLGACVATGLPTASASPWRPIDLGIAANPLDLAFTDERHGYLVGSNRTILETNDGGSHWEGKELSLPKEDNFRLISIDFAGQDGWIAGQPGLLMHSSDGGSNWTRLFLDTKLPGEPYVVTALGEGRAELATNVGAIYRTADRGNSWEAEVGDAAGAVRDLRRDPEGNYVSVSSLGNFYATWQPGEQAWQVHQRASSQRLQSLGFQPSGELWMVARGAQIRFDDQPGDQEGWSKAIVPITNGYGYLDMAWDPDGTIWAGGGNGTLLSSRDGGSSWERDPVGQDTPTNFTRFVFPGSGKGFALGERGLLLRWVG